MSRVSEIRREPMYTLALIGHSNLPKIVNYADVIVECFKCPEAKLTDVTNPEKFDQRMLHRRWDCVILFLGGEDLAECRDQKVIFDRFVAVLDVLNARKVLLTDLEPRIYSSRLEERYGINTQDYNNLKDIVNKRLQRYSKRSQRFQLVHVPPAYQNDTWNGILLGEDGQESLVLKYLHLIKEHREKTGR